MPLPILSSLSGDSVEFHWKFSHSEAELSNYYILLTTSQARLLYDFSFPSTIIDLSQRYDIIPSVDGPIVAQLFGQDQGRNTDNVMTLSGLQADSQYQVYFVASFDGINALNFNDGSDVAVVNIKTKSKYF